MPVFGQALIMKKFTFLAKRERAIYQTALILAIAMSLMILPGTSLAGWVLYDNFNSGTINPAKWNIDNSSATITVEGGRVKFVHRTGTAGDSSWLTIKRNPRGVKGVRADILIMSFRGRDPRARIGTIPGYANNGNRRLWQSFEARPGRRWLSGSVSVNNSNWVWLRNLVWHSQQEPILLVGRQLRISITTNLSARTFSFFARGYGNNIFTSYENLSAYTNSNPFSGIGTRTSSAAGSIVVYFDNVWVLR